MTNIHIYKGGGGEGADYPPPPLNQLFHHHQKITESSLLQRGLIFILPISQIIKGGGGKRPK